MFVTIESFTQAWEEESTATQRLLASLTDDSLSQPVDPKDPVFRTLGRIAWHIVWTVHEMPSHTGLRIASPGDENAVPASAAAIADSYATTSKALVAAVLAQWQDADLLKTTNMYGEEWRNGVVLRSVIQHEVHHRGQMTVLMRQAGLRPPALYGPVREDWQAMGMQPPVV